ncbi:MAG: MATE family efflux transporter [Oscillospiraceae bacterium]
MERNLTSGSVLKNIIYFSLPYMLSYFLQTLYGMADLFIIGQFDGVAGTTAVSNGSQVMYMLTVIIVGLAMGTTVNIGKAVGRRDREDISRIIGNTATLFMTISVVLMVVLILLVRLIVSVIGTPSQAVEGSANYLTVCFIGIPFITAYNIISSIFRGMGDSKSPMYFIATACFANIVLDYLFMGVLKLGPTGAALGTTLSQTLSVLISLIYIRKKNTGIELEKSDLKPDKETIGKILKTGIPVSLQDGFIQVAFIIITVIANHRGINDAAAVGIVEKVIGVLFIVPSSMLATVSALSAQNIGAKKYDRAEKTLRYAIILTVSYGIVVATITQFISKLIISLFSPDSTVILLGSEYLTGYSWDCIFAGIHFCFTGYFCAYGKSYIGFVHNIISILFIRIPGSYLASAMFSDTLLPMGFAASAGSVLSILICVGAFIWLKTHSLKNLKSVAS